MQAAITTDHNSTEPIAGHSPLSDARAPLEIWGGVECTVNRVGETYFDQLEMNGHATRIADLDRFAELGIRTLRYPILWERTAPEGLARADWRWADERMARLGELGVRPIVGLVHHGSGPRDTSLLDPHFAEKLAAYAEAVARRYPWARDFTPVNEPLTTARFAALYGHWYPHRRDTLSFARALIHQCRAIAAAMQAIRRVIPGARLIQTEDFGRIYSTPLLRYQAAFENDRRFLSLDLLCGRVDRFHPLWEFLTRIGIHESELAPFLESPCPPDIVGINHYVTSDRFLDEHLERYPPQFAGGNGIHAYADVEAVRACDEAATDPYGVLDEVWRRYRLPVAVTETHLGCTREEQMRWFKEMWDAATRVRREGGDVRALTVWSLLGSYDWNSLVTRRDGHYESGVFCLKAPSPRPTALAELVRSVAQGEGPDHPALDVEGWWRRPARWLHPDLVPAGATRAARPARRPRELLIVGATGTLGQAFARLCDERGLPHRLVGRKEMDIADATGVEKMLEGIRPWAIVNTAGYVRVDDAEKEPERCYRENVIGAATLAESCARREVPLLTFSSDLVFDGNTASPYTESGAVAPLNVYGRTKAEAEKRVLDEHPAALVVRTSAFFGPWDEHNFVTFCLKKLARGEPIVAAEDAVVSPTYVPHLVHASLDLLLDGEKGLWHIANRGAISWADLAGTVATLAGADRSRVRAVPTAQLGLNAARPSYSALESERGMWLPPLDSGLASYFRDRG